MAVAQSSVNEGYKFQSRNIKSGLKVVIEKVIDERRRIKRTNFFCVYLVFVALESGGYKEIQDFTARNVEIWVYQT